MAMSQGTHTAPRVLAASDPQIATPTASMKLMDPATILPHTSLTSLLPLQPHKHPRSACLLPHVFETWPHLHPSHSSHSCTYDTPAAPAPPSCVPAASALQDLCVSFHFSHSFHLLACVTQPAVEHLDLLFPRLSSRHPRLSSGHSCRSSAHPRAAKRQSPHPSDPVSTMYIIHSAKTE